MTTIYYGNIYMYIYIYIYIYMEGPFREQTNIEKGEVET